ncbi:NAD-P-binding protein [Gloeopeniophorella convolvens]|nr:NAD-P-binding protein [Gloeopeniophorella convolvens]
MSGHKSFAVAGAGTFGAYVVKELLKAKAEGTVNDVVVLTRVGSKVDFEGARVIAVDYNDKESIKAALSGVDVVISAISAFVLNVQSTIAAAAKEAGVKLFVPSEFAGDAESARGGFYAAKGDLRASLRAIGPPLALFYTGVWSDFVWNQFLQLDILSGKITVGGDGNYPISWTSRTDSARFIVHILTRLPRERLENSIFRCEADRKSYNEVVRLYEDKTGKKVEVEYIPASVLTERVNENPEDVVSYIQLSVVNMGLGGKPDNDLFPDWKPAPAIDGVPLA